MVFFNDLLFDKHKEKFETGKVDLMDLREIFDNRDNEERQAMSCENKVVKRQSFPVCNLIFACIRQID